MDLAKRVRLTLPIPILDLKAQDSEVTSIYQKAILARAGARNNLL